MLDGALGFVRGAVVGGDLVFVVELEPVVLTSERSAGPCRRRTDCYRRRDYRTVAGMVAGAVGCLQRGAGNQQKKARRRKKHAEFEGSRDRVVVADTRC